VKNLCKTSAKKLVCGAKSERVRNFSGFAGKNQSLASFLNKVITRDESWVFDYNPETKWQSAD
jgi:hypothetical protein